MKRSDLALWVISLLLIGYAWTSMALQEWAFAVAASAVGVVVCSLGLWLVNRREGRTIRRWRSRHVNVIRLSVHHWLQPASGGSGPRRQPMRYRDGFCLRLPKKRVLMVTRWITR